MDEKSVKLLKDYELSLEDLTFNSKPIINMLTMLADKHRPLAGQIVELIESRFFKVLSHYSASSDERTTLTTCILCIFVLFLMFFIMLYSNV